MNSDQIDDRLRELCKSGEIYSAVEDYIRLCTPEDDGITSNGAPSQKNSTSKRSKDRDIGSSFPNLAGFCRYLGIGTEELEALANEYPLLYGRILAVLEDEALNSGLSPTLISAYLKKRIGYENPPKPSSAEGQLEIRFEHDIFEDGE